MTIREVIKQLVNYNNLDAQLVDGHGFPIVSIGYHDRESDRVHVISTKEIDSDDMIFEIIDQGLWLGNTGVEICEELKERGFTLDEVEKVANKNFSTNFNPTSWWCD